MMLGNGGLIVLRAPGQIVGFPENETERAVKDFETILGHGRRVFVCQVCGSNFEKFQKDPMKPTGLGVKPMTFKDKPSENVKFKGAEVSSKGMREGTSGINKQGHNSDSTSKKKYQHSSGSRQQLDEHHSSPMPPTTTHECNDEDWRSLSRAIASSQKISAISNHELMKIAELRFSTDMCEGDSGSQVVLLQKALFWLGYLLKQSDITGYFGVETKQGLCEFQEAHGVSQTGAWGSVSKQALWHTISAEILHRVVDEKASKTGEALSSGISGELGVPNKLWQTWTSLTLPDGFSAAISLEGNWGLLSRLVLLIGGILFGLFISKVSSHTARDNSVKRRIVRFSEPDNFVSFLQNEKQSTANPSSDGAAVIDKMSQFHSKLSHNTENEAGGHSDPAHVPQKKLTNFMHVSSLGHGVQDNVGKKTTYVPGVPSLRASSSLSFKPGTETLRSGKQSGSRRPTQEVEDASTIRRNSRLELSPLSRQEITRSRKEASGPQGNSFSVPRNNRAIQRDDITRPKKLDDDFGYSKSDKEVSIHEEDEPNVQQKIEELRKTIEAAEQNGQAAVHALAEERRRSMELKQKITRQRESAAALEEEVRVLKESHDALLESLRKENGSAARGASLLYQNFEGDGNR